MELSDAERESLSELISVGTADNGNEFRYVTDPEIRERYKSIVEEEVDEESMRIGSSLIPMDRPRHNFYIRPGFRIVIANYVLMGNGQRVLSAACFCVAGSKLADILENNNPDGLFAEFNTPVFGVTATAILKELSQGGEWKSEVVSPVFGIWKKV